MILFLILSIVVFLKCDKQLFAVVYSFNILYLIIFLFEVGLTDIMYLTSDGYRYFHLAEVYLAEDPDRTVWISINYFLNKYDLFGEFFCKIINIPFCVYLLHKINSIFDIRNKFILFFLAPFIIVLSVSNLRDLLILIATIHLCIGLNNLKTKTQRNLIYLFVSALFLYNLRPILLFASLVIFLIVNYKYYIKNKINLILVIILLSSTFYLSSEYIDRIIYNGTYFFAEGIVERAGINDFEYFYPDNLPLTFSYASLRYILTPMPTSIIERLFSDYSHKYGNFSEIIRLFHQIIYYFVLIFTFFNWRKIWSFLKKLNSLYKLILLNFLVYMPIYSVYAFGGVHQRTKFPFQLALIIIYIVYRQFKKKSFSTKKVLKN